MEKQVSRSFHLPSLLRQISVHQLPGSGYYSGRCGRGRVDYYLFSRCALEGGPWNVDVDELTCLTPLHGFSPALTTLKSK